MERRSRMHDVTLLCHCGKEILRYLDDAARLRIEVFRDYPYLYDGSPEYEREYLQQYSHCAESVFVCAIAADRIVGVSTALPLTAADESFQAPFRDAGMAIEEIFYLGESVLLPEYRGQGIGHAFFDHREAQARKLGCKMTTFCSVIRPAAHPLQPAAYRDNESFWQKRGYARNGLSTHLSWQECGDDEETMHELEFWCRAHPGASGV
jgi:GNAT superfamily N-acetyltransferase